MSVRGRSLEKLLQNLLDWSDWQKLPLSGLWVENSRRDSGVRGIAFEKKNQPNKLSISLWLFLFLVGPVRTSMSLCFFAILAYLVRVL